MEGREEGRDYGDELRVEEDGKTLDGGSEGVAETSRPPRAVAIRADSTTHEKRYFLGGWRKLKYIQPE